MAKRPVITTVSSGFNSTTILNSNFEALRDAFDNFLSLDGETPNAMLADLDLNSNDLLNVKDISMTGSLTINGTPLSSFFVPQDGSVTEAKLDVLNEPVDNYVLSYDLASGRLEWVDVTAASGSGANLSNTPAASTLTIESDTGNDTILPAATTSLAGVMTGADKTKLDGIETGATADQTAGEIKTAYESNADTNPFTDAEQTKLAGVETGATADQTGAEIKTLYEAELDTNAFTDADHTKLDSLHEGYDTDQTFSIPTDFATFQDAIDTLSKRPKKQGVRYILELETGQTLSSGITVSHGDYGHFVLRSVDATVSLSSWTAGTSLIIGVNARMPVWGLMVNCGTNDVNDANSQGAIVVRENSTLNIENGAGLIGPGATGNNGLFVYRNSRVEGSEVSITNFDQRNLFITHCSDAWLEKVTATGAGQYGMFCSRLSRGYVVGGNFSNSTSDGIHVLRSFVAVFPFAGANVVFDNCSTGIYASSGSKVIALERSGNNVQFTNCVHGVDALNGAYIDVQGATFSTISGNAVRTDAGGTVNCTDSSASNITGDVISASGGTVIADNMTTATLGANGINAAEGAYISAQSGNFDNATGSGLIAKNGATVNAQSANFGNAGAYGVLAQTGARVNVSSGVCSGCTSGGIRAEDGAHVSAFDVNARSGGTNASTDIQVIRGSLISILSGIGGINQTGNTVTSDGIIFK